MSFKKSTLFALSISIFSLNSIASTIINCAGNNQSLEILLNQNKSGVSQTLVKFGDTMKSDFLAEKMNVEILILPAGTYYVDKEVRSYSGHYSEGGLNFGFVISQVFDLSGKMTQELKNTFGVNQQKIGTCKVTQVE